jgi:hypothetical protein
MSDCQEAAIVVAVPALNEPCAAIMLGRLTVSREAGGLRLCLEGLVPPQAWPSRAELSDPEARQAALDQIRAAFPKLIPPLWLDLENNQS